MVCCALEEVSFVSAVAVMYYLNYISLKLVRSLYCKLLLKLLVSGLHNRKWVSLSSKQRKHSLNIRLSSRLWTL